VNILLGIGIFIGALLVLYLAGALVTLVMEWAGW
jgi:hypothetical protein